jgi:predicted secreted protein
MDLAVDIADETDVPIQQVAPTEEEQQILQDEYRVTLQIEQEEAEKARRLIESSEFNRAFDAANKHVDSQIEKAEQYHEKVH